MLSDEEKKAVEILNKWLCKTHSEFCKIGAVGIPNEEFFATEIVLSLIKKQSKEIEHQIEKRANQKKELAILNAKQIEFNKLVNTVDSYKGQFKRQQKEIEELKEERKKYPIAMNDEQYKKVIELAQKEIEELKRVDKSNSQIIANMSTRHFNDREKIRKYEKLVDKIKVKIEEYDDKGMTVNLANKSAGKTFQQAVHYEVKKILQSLLEEKE